MIGVKLRGGKPESRGAVVREVHYIPFHPLLRWHCQIGAGGLQNETRIPPLAQQEGALPEPSQRVRDRRREARGIAGDQRQLQKSRVSIARGEDSGRKEGAWGGRG